LTFPSPEIGLVISYSYLWRYERAAGHTEGKYDRPAAIILVQEQGLKPLVTVVPITHSLPRTADVAIPSPRKVAAELGFDSQQSWVVVSDSNQFTYPGFDLRENKEGQYSYGFIAPKFMEQIQQKFVELAEQGLQPTSRDDTQTLPTSAKPSKKSNAD
jgi:hypothetical protein